ncbi:MAG TPA: hypothetical protein VF459_06180 [Caulobacteraceae bacterium]
MSQAARSAGLVLLAAVAAMTGLAFVLPIDHDEGQYVAAAALTARGLRPYADFIYLQTPLQPLLTAPIAALAQGWSLIALRLSNALAGAGVLTLVFLIQQSLGVTTRRAAAATALMGACYIFQFACGVARNDALPALAEVLALAAALGALKDGEPGGRAGTTLWLLTGLALGAAVSFKISYAIPLAGAGLFVLVGAFRRLLTWNGLLGFCAGALVGVAPCLIGLAATPGAYVFDTLIYHATAPKIWYAAIGQAARLSPLAKASDTLLALAVGPALEVLAAVVTLAVLRIRDGAKAASSRRLIEILAVAGLVAALAPAPTQRQYFLPLLPFLFILWGLGETGLARPVPLALQRGLAAAIAVGAMIGVGRYAYLAGDAALGLAHGVPPPPIRLTLQAHWIGQRLRAAGASGQIATPSPQAAADSGYPLDARLAAGPFFYRTGDLTSDDEQRALHGVSPRTLAAVLDAAPPAAIVTGLESRQGPGGRTVDDDFRAYARLRGYQTQASPSGTVELFIRPSATPLR